MRTPGSSYSSCTTSSLEIVAAPRRANAASASLFPAPTPPVTATASGLRRLFVGRGRRFAVRIARALLLWCDRVGLDALIDLLGSDVRLGRRDVRSRVAARILRGLHLGDRLVGGLVATPLLREHLVGEVDLRRGGGRGRLERLPVGARLHLVGLLDALEREREAAPVGVDLDDLDVDDIALGDDLARVLDVVLRELGDVHEALDARENLDEGAERDDLRHLALHDVVLLVGLDDLLPRIRLGLLETK